MPEKTMSDQEMRTTMAEAEAHFTRYAWDEALACFNRVLAASPRHGGAADGKDRVEKQKRWDGEIQQKIADAREACQAQRYADAVGLLDVAQGLGADHHILKYHADIDALRNEVREHQRWERRVREDMESAARLSRQNDVDGALVILDTLLRDLAAAGLADLGKEARRVADDLTERTLFEVQLKRAKTAFENEDYELAVSLSETLNSQARGNKEVAAVLSGAAGYWRRISQQLHTVETALNEDNLPDAVAVLQNLRRDFPKNPNWQALWLQGHRKHALASVERGRLALPGRDFDAARQAFEAAGAAFQAVLDVFPEHPLAEPGRREADALREVAICCVQAQRNFGSRQWDAARESLLMAQEKLGAATQVRRTDFNDINAALQAFLAEVQTTINDLAQARARLTQGEQRLKDREPGQAEESFRQGLEALRERDTDLHRRLAEGLGQADRMQKDVRRLHERALSSADESERLRLFKSAYDTWPAAPGLLDAYVDALLTAAQAAAQRGDLKQAADWYTQVLGLPNVAADKTAIAQQQWDYVGADQAVQAALQQARTQQGSLEAASTPRSAEWLPLVDLLVRAREQAGSRAELRALVERSLQPAEARLNAIRTAEPLLQQAELKTMEGEWLEAAGLAQKAMDAVGDLSAADWRQRTQNLQTTARQISDTLDQARALFERAQEIYRAGRSGDTAAVEWPALDAALASAAQLLGAKPAGVDSLPKDWQTLAQQVEDLQAVSRLIQNALGRMVGENILEALATLNQAVVLRPNDPVLKQIAERQRRESTETLQRQAEALVAEATEMIERGEAGGAQEKLRQARGAANFSAIDAQLRRMQAQAELWQKIQGQLEVGYSRVNSSVSGAVEAFGQALRAATHVDSGLTSEMRTAVNDLLALETDLHLDEAIGRSDACLTVLEKEGAQHRLFTRYQLGSVARKWRDLAHQKAAEAQVASLIAVGLLEKAYAEALVQSQAAPQNKAFQDQAAEARSQLRTRLLDSIRERCSRAQTLAERGAYAEALQALAEVESRWIEPMTQKFPEIVENDKEIAEAQSRAQDLSIDIKPWQDKAQGLALAISQIQSVYAAGNLGKAQELLGQAEEIDPDHHAKIHWGQLQELRQQTQRGRYAILRHDLELVLGKADAVPTAQKAADVRPILIELNALAASVRENLAGSDDAKLRERYDVAVLQAQKRLDQLEGAETAQEVAAEAEASNTIEAMQVALKSLQRALDRTSGGAHETLQIRYDALEERLRQKKAEVDAEKALRTLWDEAVADLEASDYQKARQELREFSARARGLGKSVAEVEPYRRATEAGLMLQRARELMKTYPEEAQRVLNLDVLAATVDCAPAAAIRQEADRYLAQLTGILTARAEEEKRQAGQRVAQEKELAEQAKRIDRLLRSARSSLRQGQFETAQGVLDELFGLQPEHAEAQALQEQVDQALAAQTLLRQASVQREAGNYKAALGLVTQALETYKNYPDAARLLPIVKAEAEAGEHLARARSLAREDQFAQARQEYDIARQKYPGHPQLNEVQDFVTTQEDNFRRRMLNPVEEARHRNDFRGALKHLAQLAQQVAPGDLKTEVSQLQQTVVNEWAESTTAQVQRTLQSLRPGDDPARLLEPREELQEIATQTPPPAARLAQPLRSLIDQIDRQRLQRRITEAIQARDNNDLEAAEVIADEVYNEAETLNQMALSRAATQLKVDIAHRQAQRDDQQKAEQQRQAQERHGQALAAARERLLNAADLADLNEARRLAREARAVEGYADDLETETFLRDVELEIKRYQDTTRSLEDVRGLLRRAAYRRALEQLQLLDTPSRLLQTQAAKLLNLARSLDTASSQEVRETETALAVYRQAIEAEPTLANNLQTAVDRCRTTLCTRAMDDIRRLLDAPVPDHETASRRLQGARAANWIVTTEQQRHVDELQQRIDTLGLTATAAQALNERQNWSEALSLLDQVRTRAPDGRLDALSDAWQRVANALQALALAQRDLDQKDIESVRRQAAQIPESLGNQPAVLKLQADLETSSSLAASLGQTETVVRAALDKLPPDFAGAVDAARPAPHARGEQLRQTVQREIEKAARALREQERYAELPALIEHWRNLLPGDGQPQQWLESAEAERTARLETTITLASQALEADALDKARVQIEHARKLATPAEVTRINDVARRVDQRSRDLEKVGQLVDDARQALAQGIVAAAIDNALQARSLAPRYDRMLQLVNDVRAALAEQIHGLDAAGRYDEGLNLCDQALRLGADAPFPALRTNLQQLQEAALARQKEQANAAYEQARAALLIMDLVTVRQAINEGKQAQPGDARFANLENQLLTVQAQADDLRRLMTEAWKALQARNFEAAQSSLGLIIAKASDFEEPRLWQRYTGNIVDGIKYVERQEHPAAAACFAEAEKALRLTVGRPLSPLWPTLTSERRRAVYYAARLREEAAGIASDRQRGSEFQRQGDVRRALDTLRAAQNRHNQFANLVSTAVEPPADFDATTGQGSGGQAQAPVRLAATAVTAAERDQSPAPATPQLEIPVTTPEAAAATPARSDPAPAARGPAPAAAPVPTVSQTPPVNPSPPKAGPDRAPAPADTPTLVLPVIAPAPAQPANAPAAPENPAPAVPASPPAPPPPSPPPAAEPAPVSYDDWFSGQTLVIPTDPIQEKKK
jgi:hypothetical protein